jgi:hypothetical protein
VVQAPTLLHGLAQEQRLLSPPVVVVVVIKAEAPPPLEALRDVLEVHTATTE